MLGLMERGFGLGSHAALDGIVPDVRVGDGEEPVVLLRKSLHWKN